jgi:hypothetical protein
LYFYKHPHLTCSRNFQTYITQLKHSNNFSIAPVINKKVGNFNMNTSCPSCNSSSIITRNIGRKTGGAVGTTAGTLSGVATSYGGAKVGASIGIVGGPIGAALGSLAGAIIGGLVGGTAGGVAGSKLGKTIDEIVLDNYECTNCHHTFSLSI